MATSVKTRVEVCDYNGKHCYAKVTLGGSDVKETSDTNGIAVFDDTYENTKYTVWIEKSGRKSKKAEVYGGTKTYMEFDEP